MNALTQDLVHAIRLASKRPGFAVAVVFTLALGIGVNTAVFDLINTVVLRPLPYAESERLFALFERDPVGTGLRVASYPTAADWRDQSDVFDGLAFIRGAPMTYQTAQQTGLVIGAFVSQDFFPLLGVPAAFGRGLQPDDYTSGNNNVAVLAHHAWQNWFGADASVVGQVFRTEDQVYTIVGVMPPTFVYPNWGTVDTDMWLPIPALPAQELAALEQRDFHADSWVIARLRQDVPLQAAEAQMNTIVRGLAAAYPADGDRTGVTFAPLRRFLARDVRARLFMLGGAVSLVLLIACANLANLYLAQGAARRREFAVRAALGAGRWRVVRQLLTETMTLAILGGIGGAFIAAAMIGVIKTTNTLALPRINELGVDTSLLAFATGLTVLTAILFAAIGAKHVSSDQLSGFLNNRDGWGGTSGKLSDGVLSAQLGLTFVLLVGATLLVQSFWRLSRVDPGFDPNNLVVVPITPPSPRYDSASEAVDLYHRLAESIGAVAGVVNVALINHTPPSRAGAPTSAALGQVPTGSSDDVSVVFRTVSAGYFSMMGIPVVAGREFNDADLDGPPGPVVVNQTLARMWTAESPLGRRLGVLKAASTLPDFGEPIVGTVVGVVGDIGDFAIEPEPRPYVYVPFTHNPWAAMNVIARAGIAPEQIIPAIVEAVRQVDPAIPLGGRFVNVRAVGARNFGITSRQRFNARLVSAFATAALVLAAVGIYSVLAYSVARQTRQIGIRIALGAAPSKVVSEVIVRVIRIALVGMVGGVIAAVALTRLMQGMLYQVKPTDPVTFAGVGLLLVGVVLVAGYVPARRAARVDPTIALRAE